jgi:hypothetical protein
MPVTNTAQNHHGFMLETARSSWSSIDVTHSARALARIPHFWYMLDLAEGLSKAF